MLRGVEGADPAAAPVVGDDFWSFFPAEDALAEALGAWPLPPAHNGSIPTGVSLARNDDVGHYVRDAGPPRRWLTLRTRRR